REAIITGYHGGADRGLRDRRWSLIERPAGQPDELYDLVADPFEQRNLIDEQPEEALRLARHFGRIYRREPRKRLRGLRGEDGRAGGTVEELRVPPHRGRRSRAAVGELRDGAAGWNREGRPGAPGGML